MSDVQVYSLQARQAALAAFQRSLGRPPSNEEITALSAALAAAAGAPRPEVTDQQIGALTEATRWWATIAEPYTGLRALLADEDAHPDAHARERTDDISAAARRLASRLGPLLRSVAP